MLILLVDDDRLARQGLAALLSELVPEVELCEAADGLAMVEAVRELRPDVAIVDVDMPRLDGLSAVEQLGEVEHETSFVVLSAFADFSFAQRGIALRVSDYLLKPAEPADLLTAISKAIDDREARREQQEALFHSQVTSLVRSRLADPARFATPSEPPAQPPDGPRFIFLAAAAFRDHAPGETPTEDFPGTLAEGAPASWLSVAVQISPPDARTEVGLVVLRAPAGTDSELAEHLDAACRSASGDGLVSALWASAPTAEAALRRLEAADLTPSLRLLGRPGRATMAPSDVPVATARLCAGLDAVYEAAHLADQVRFLTAVERLRDHGPLWPRALHLTDVAGFATAILGHPVQWGNLGAFLDSLTTLGPRLVRRSTGTAASRIGRIQQYLAESFAEPLSLASVAKRFDLTPTYLSALFHEKTGKTFLTYLTELRIAHAQQVLENDPEVQVRELAALSGYTSTRHFSQMFRRLTGHYPSKYAAVSTTAEDASPTPGRSTPTSTSSDPGAHQP